MIDVVSLRHMSLDDVLLDVSCVRLTHTCLSLIIHVSPTL